MFLNQIILDDVNNKYYELLEIDSDSDIDEIKKAYKKKAHQLHPDKNTNDTTAEFQKLNEAYLAICNSKKEPFPENSIFYYNDSQSETSCYFSDIEVIKYSTSIDTLSCECDDWIKNRSSYHKADPRILCKHLISEFLVPELNDIILPASFLVYKEEILQSKYEGKGFPLFEDIVFFKHSIVALSKSKGEIYIKGLERIRQIMIVTDGLMLKKMMAV